MDKNDDTKSGWLYRYGGHVYGPVEESRLIELIMAGAVPGELEVARDGEEFHPASRVLRFQATVAKARRLHGGKETGPYRKMRSAVLLLGVCCVLGSLGAVFVEANAVLAQHEAAVEDARGILEKAEKAQDLPRLALTALPAKAPVVAKRGGADRSGVKRRPSRRPVRNADAEDEDDSMVATCERSDDEIIKTVERYLGKINTCILDGRERGESGSLDGALTVAFVVRPTGSLVEFEVEGSSEHSNRMVNCLSRVFTRIKFARTGGTNCPVSLPITIGG
jgi:hypothetical protein